MQDRGLKTIELYGISDEELHARLGKASIKAGYETRIAVLKENLVKLRDADKLLSYEAEKIEKAIKFWRGFLDKLEQGK
ncbi:MAG: hypothetical protein ACWGHH_06745 [Sulfurovaceae bacterium]